MSIHARDLPDPDRDALLPLLVGADPERPVAWRGGAAVSVREFRAHVYALARRLPAGRHAINLCEDRYHFLVGFGSALLRGQTSLLPPSRAPHVVDEVRTGYAEAHAFADDLVASAIADGETGDPHAPRPPPLAGIAAPADAIRGSMIAVIGFTSGSTGQPRPHLKHWSGYAHSNARNAEVVRARLAARDLHGRPWIVATVPPQHMYGMETSVLMPMIGDMAVHAARPLFPSDVAAALAELPSPRVLVSTPVHLRALVESGVGFPEVALVVCATAPLDAALAGAVERALDTEVCEMFGSTETCVIAHRRTAHEQAWTLYDGVTLSPEPDGTRTEAAWFDEPIHLQDLVELLPDRRFALRGRNVDLIEIAGKRASLSDLTRRVLAVPGVRDAVVLQAEGDGPVRRVAALVVAPGLAAEDVLAQLRPSIDPAFLPRPLVLVDALPRNEVGKLAREKLLALLRRP